MSNYNIISLDSLSLQEFDTEADLIPLLTPEDEEEMNNEELPASLPILPLQYIRVDVTKLDPNTWKAVAVENNFVVEALGIAKDEL